MLRLLASLMACRFETPVNDLSGIPVPLEAEVLEVGPGGGAPGVSVERVGEGLEVVVDGAPVCGADGLVVNAQRVGTVIHLGLVGGAPCAEGQVGRLRLRTADRPGNTRGVEVEVGFADGRTMAAPLPE